MPFHQRPSQIKRASEASPHRPPRNPLAGIDFASDEAAELAHDTPGLEAEHFVSLPQSGKSGYTAADVRKAAKRMAVPRFGG